MKVKVNLEIKPFATTIDGQIFVVEVTAKCPACGQMVSTVHETGKSLTIRCGQCGETPTSHTLMDIANRLSTKG